MKPLSAITLMALVLVLTSLAAAQMVAPPPAPPEPPAPPVAGHLVDTEDLSICETPCRNAIIREVIKKIIERRRYLHRAQSVG